MGYGITVDGSGNAYITGVTGSSDFPTTSGAFQTSFNAVNEADAFLTELNADGSALFYSTFMGSGATGGPLPLGGIALDGSGNVYITGEDEGGFPATSGVYQTACYSLGLQDGFIAKFDAGDFYNPAPLPTSTYTPTFTATPTSTPTIFITPTYTVTPTFTPTPTLTPTFTTTLTPTNSPTSTLTPTPSPIDNGSSATSTLTPTETLVSTGTATPTDTPMGGSSSGNSMMELYPNPVQTSGSVTIQLSPSSLEIQAVKPGNNGPIKKVASGSEVKVQVLTTNYRKIRDLIVPRVPASGKVVLSVVDNWGAPLSNGLYFVRVTTVRDSYVLKLLVLR